MLGYHKLRLHQIENLMLPTQLESDDFLSDLIGSGSDVADFPCCALGNCLEQVPVHAVHIADVALRRAEPWTYTLRNFDELDEPYMVEMID